MTHFSIYSKVTLMASAAGVANDPDLLDDWLNDEQPGACIACKVKLRRFETFDQDDLCHYCYDDQMAAQGTYRYKPREMACDCPGVNSSSGPTIPQPGTRKLFYRFHRQHSDKENGITLLRCPQYDLQAQALKL